MKQSGNESNELAELRGKMRIELIEEILPYWTEQAKDSQNGGFIGQVTGHQERVRDADKSVVLNARLLWTYSAAYRVLRDPSYIKCAERAFSYMEKKFYDGRFGGFYWSVDHEGQVSDRKKHAYAQSFAIYAYSEYARATGSEKALNRAFETVQLLEKHGFNPQNGGYIEAFKRDWGRLDDVRLSATDMSAARSMNTHLHILEAYTNILRVADNPELKKSLRAVTSVLTDQVYNKKTGHFDTFFNETWNRQSDIYSYGHDIEAAWLILDAATVLRDDELIKRSEQMLLDVAETTLQEGVSHKSGGVYNTGRNGTPLDTDFHWWVQAEAIVGFLYAYSISGNPDYRHAAEKIWDFIQEYIVDPDNGEWYFRVDEYGKPYLEEDKIGPWKCPYHNSRACLIIIEQFKGEPSGSDVLRQEHHKG